VSLYCVYLGACVGVLSWSCLDDEQSKVKALRKAVECCRVLLNEHTASDERRECCIVVAKMRAHKLRWCLSHGIRAVESIALLTFFRQNPNKYGFPLLPGFKRLTLMFTHVQYQRNTTL
jgi:hypothetical protein